MENTDCHQANSGIYRISYAKQRATLDSFMVLTSAAAERFRFDHGFFKKTDSMITSSIDGKKHVFVS